MARLQVIRLATFSLLLIIMLLLLLLVRGMLIADVKICTAQTHCYCSSFGAMVGATTKLANLADLPSVITIVALTTF